MYVYRDGKQYETLLELNAAIIFLWNETFQNVLKKLVQSIPNCIFRYLKRFRAYIDF